MVDVDGNCQFSVDSHPKSTDLVWGSAATRLSVHIHQVNWVNSRSDFGSCDSTIYIVVVIVIIIIPVNLHALNLFPDVLQVAKNCSVKLL